MKSTIAEQKSELEKLKQEVDKLKNENNAKHDKQNSVDLKSKADLLPQHPVTPKVVPSQSLTVSPRTVPETPKTRGSRGNDGKHTPNVKKTPSLTLTRLAKPVGCFICCDIYFYTSKIKRPAKDSCLYMGEVTPLDSPDLLDPHFLFTFSLQP